MKISITFLTFQLKYKISKKYILNILYPRIINKTK